MGRFFLPAIFLVASWAHGLTWTQTQQLPEFREAKIALGDSFPEVAAPKFNALLARKDLDQTAKLNLQALLGESLVRAEQPEAALKVLTGNGPKANTWKAHAFTQLGQLSKAAALLENVKTDENQYQLAVIANALGDSEKALTILAPLNEKNIPAQTLSLSILLDLNRLDEATKTLTAKQLEPSQQTPVLRYLNARLLLLKKDRNAAVGNFQALIDESDTDRQLPAAYFHAATLGLADALALDGNEKAATESLVGTLTRFPESP
ncbi:hypothetical protein N9Z02_02765, partial [Akkermansiaceae bacterium]|nr:hypothetical protein [Akkermansiaceae bacterium]